MIVVLVSMEKDVKVSFFGHSLIHVMSRRRPKRIGKKVGKIKFLFKSLHQTPPI